MLCTFCLFCILHNIQHLMRPSECVAKRCQMSHGRSYCYDEDNEYLLTLCTCCGSNGVHECCLNGTVDFICNDCGPPPAKKRRIVSETIAMDVTKYDRQLEVSSMKRRKIAKCIDTADINNNVQISTSTPKPKFVLRELSIKLVRLENVFKRIEWNVKCYHCYCWKIAYVFVPVLLIKCTNCSKLLLF